MVAPNLDDLELYSRIDPTNFRQRLRTFPRQCREAWEKALAFPLPSRYAAVERVVILGMGGSAIGGEMIADLASQEDSPPIAVCRGYDLPPYVDEGALVLACSYSGETEETLSGFEQALSRKAKVIAVSSGGRLAGDAAARGVPLFKVEYMGEPRSALGYSFIAPMALLVKLGLLSDKRQAMNESLELLERLLPELVEERGLAGNPAKALALDLRGRFIVVYGAGVLNGVARRWKTQFNENSKVWAFHEALPELHHNSVVGYSMPAEAKELAFVVLLKPGSLPAPMARRYLITQELLERVGIAHRLVESRGSSPLSQVLSSTLLGDYTSYYLAALQGVDPSPVPEIDFIKGRLSGGRGTQ